MIIPPFNVSTYCSDQVQPKLIISQVHTSQSNSRFIYCLSLKWSSESLGSVQPGANSCHSTKCFIAGPSLNLVFCSDHRDGYILLQGEYHSFHHKGKLSKTFHPTEYEPTSGTRLWSLLVYQSCVMPLYYTRAIGMTSTVNNNTLTMYISNHVNESSLQWYSCAASLTSEPHQEGLS